MAPLFLVIALILQVSSIYADTDVESSGEAQEIPLDRDLLVDPLNNDEVVKDFHTAQPDFVDMLLFANKMFPTMYPTSATTMMSQVTNNSSNQTSEEQLENVKKVAEQIGMAIQSEIANLMSFAMALNATNRNATDNGSRSKRSVETPMDSTQMIMRLLKHIKATNEYQNIAIEKMMTAQEIADKFGIEFNADSEILSDLALAANEHAQELSSILKDFSQTPEVQFIPMDEEPMQNKTFYVYTLHPEEETIQDTTVPPFEYLPDIVSEQEKSGNYVGYEPEPHYHNHHSYETQIPAPPVHRHSPSVTPRPNFYDPLPYNDYYGYVDPFSSTILIPIEEPEPEQELVGEEIEETVTTKLSVERGDEPGSSTVNQVTTYTVAEKTHFRTPQIKQLPQHFQYCFFLV